MAGLQTVLISPDLNLLFLSTSVLFILGNCFSHLGYIGSNCGLLSWKVMKTIFGVEITFPYRYYIPLIKWGNSAKGQSTVIFMYAHTCIICPIISYIVTYHVISYKLDEVSVLENLLSFHREKLNVHYSLQSSRTHSARSLATMSFHDPQCFRVYFRADFVCNRQILKVFSYPL